MEMSFDLPLEDELPIGNEIKEEENRKISEKSLVTSVGRYLALDISLFRSGICIYDDGQKNVLNYKVPVDENDCFAEVKARRSLKEYLTSIIGGLNFELIMIEDAYQGVNPDTTRKLYALNTAIDELILDGVVECKKFLRVANGTWKRWLYSVDIDGRYRLLNDKARIEACLGLLGVKEEGKGYQDRLDACGMLLGYFLCGYKEERKEKAVSFSYSDICCSYQEDEDFILEEIRQERQEDDLSITRWNIGQKKLSKSLIKKLLEDNPDRVYMTSDMVRVGYLLKEFNLEVTESGLGYFAFWLKRSKYKKLRVL